MQTTQVKLIFIVWIALLANYSYSQCNTADNNLQDFSILSYQESVATNIIDEISGLTYNDATEELYVVSDDGKLARRQTNGTWQAISVNDWSGNNCKTNKFGDIEGITYMGSSGTNTHSYAIAEERERHITFVTMSSSQTSLSFPINAFLKFSGISFTQPNCGGNDGIEGLAYDVNLNTMYFSTERNSQAIYSFIVPNSINGQTILPNQIIDLSDISGLNSYAIHGMDILPNGNIITLVAKQGPSNVDPGLYDRMIIEFDPCGTILSQKDLEPTINDSSELEGIAFVNQSICVIGEFGTLYHIETSPIASNPDCKNTIVVNDDPIPAGVYETKTSILSNGTVASLSDVEYSTGDYIDLMAGFEVKSNAEFSAHIQGCE